MRRNNDRRRFIWHRHSAFCGACDSLSFIDTKEKMMRITQLIKRLETAKKRYGNIEVTVFDSELLEKDGFITGVTPNLCYEENHNGKVVALTFCDKRTADAFR
jgi:hypothetical protein